VGNAVERFVAVGGFVDYKPMSVKMLTVGDEEGEVDDAVEGDMHRVVAEKKVVDKVADCMHREVNEIAGL
jgi:hypothetical protein